MEEVFVVGYDQGEDSLRQFGEQEENYNGYEHCCGPVVFPLSPLPSALLVVFFRAFSSAAFRVGKSCFSEFCETRFEVNLL